MSRFLGRSAEKAFGQLCSDNHVTCNDAKEDDHGWDHVVEFPQEPVPGVSADMQRGIPAIFVQTKSHKIFGLRVTMKLSNALKLARSPAPAFVVLRAADGSSHGGNSNWYAIHFWKDLMERALKRARKASRDGIAEEELHKATFSFSLSESDRFDSAELLPWIKSTVRGVGVDYATVKRTLLPAEDLVFEFDFGDNENYEQFIDHSLGLLGDVKVDNVSVKSQRFGIALPLTPAIPEGVSGTLSVKATPVEKCDVLLRGPDGSSLQIVGDIIVPAVPNFSPHFHRIRIKTAMLDFILKPEGSATLSMHWDKNRKYDIKELCGILRILSWSDSGEIGIFVTLRDQKLFSASAHFDGIFDKNAAISLLPVVTLLDDLTDHLKAVRPEISISDVYATENMIEFYRIMRGKDMKIRSIFENFRDFSKISYSVVSAAVCVGEWVIAAILRFPISDHSCMGNAACWRFGEPRILQTYAFRSEDDPAINQFCDDFKGYVSTSSVLGIENILAFFGNSDGSMIGSVESG